MFNGGMNHRRGARATRTWSTAGEHGVPAGQCRRLHGGLLRREPRWHAMEGRRAMQAHPESLIAAPSRPAATRRRCGRPSSSPTAPRQATPPRPPCSHRLYRAPELAPGASIYNLLDPEVTCPRRRSLRRGRPDSCLTPLQRQGSRGKVLLYHARQARPRRARQRRRA